MGRVRDLTTETTERTEKTAKKSLWTLALRAKKY